MMKKICSIGLILVLALAAATQAAPTTLAPERMLVLVVGPTTTPIHPDEGEVVQRLNQLRRQNGLDQMQLATMHYDQPAQARVCREVLSIQSRDLVAVSLVELDAKGNPVRSLYTLPRVTPANLDQLQGTLSRFSQLSGLPLHNPNLADDFPVSQEMMTSEGVQNTARRLDDLAQALWVEVRNQPLRPDQADLRARQALLNLAENSLLLRQALDRGVINPREQFQLVLTQAQEWKDSRPELYLPIPSRAKVAPINEAIQGVRQAWLQLNPGLR